MARIFATVLGLIVLCAFMAHGRPAVTLYVYHLKAPYIIDLTEEQGLYYDIAALFNRHQDSVQFITHYLPRKRLDKLIEDNQLDGLVLGVNPIWFGDVNRQKYLWTNSLVEDVDDFVSNKNKPFEYEGRATLIGKTVGGILGYRYFGVDELAQEEKLERVNTNEELQLLEMVLKGRLDTAIVSRKTRRYLERQNDWKGVFHISELPHDRFTRHIMALPLRSESFMVVESLLAKPTVQAELSQLVAMYIE
ncbi:hypothetical protein PALB_31140 [Pseudoalteromonas luteoviolacea B = ATCC 29581]|nr:hypothetical protein PALB_31140 [Pseudoalteromonas luteoviolacea B = ATCC 29581]